MSEQSAGLLVFRRRGGEVEFLLAHPGGPFWKHRDEGAWTIPKGLVGKGEDLLAAAVREFEEEVGQRIAGDFQPLTPLRQKSGKIVHAWLAEADLDLSTFRSNLFELEWPRGSGVRRSFAEIDRADYFPFAAAAEKILPGQKPFLEEAAARLGRG